MPCRVEVFHILLLVCRGFLGTNQTGVLYCTWTAKCSWRCQIPNYTTIETCRTHSISNLHRSSAPHTYAYTLQQQRKTSLLSVQTGRNELLVRYSRGRTRMFGRPLLLDQYRSSRVLATYPEDGSGPSLRNARKFQAHGVTSQKTAALPQMKHTISEMYTTQKFSTISQQTIRSVEKNILAIKVVLHCAMWLPSKRMLTQY